MPVLVVGADTALGSAITAALDGRAGERRAFVSDPTTAEVLRTRSWKTAVGDVSDGSHVGGAALGAFTVVLVAEALFDGRERAFAASPEAAVSAWAEAVTEAGASRVIWVDDARLPRAADRFRAEDREVATVTVAGRPMDAIGAEVARLDDLASLDEV